MLAAIAFAASCLVMCFNVATLIVPGIMAILLLIVYYS